MAKGLCAKPAAGRRKKFSVSKSEALTSAQLPVDQVDTSNQGKGACCRKAALWQRNAVCEDPRQRKPAGSQRQCETIGQPESIEVDGAEDGERDGQEA